MSPALEVSQSREASTLLRGIAIGALPGDGVHPAAEITQRTTRVTARGSLAVEVVKRASGRGETTLLKATHSSNSAGPLTLADGVSPITLYVDATAAGPRTPTRHVER